MERQPTPRPPSPTHMSPTRTTPPRRRTSPTRSRTPPTRRQDSSGERTNTLIITQLPRECFERSALAAIRAAFARHGEIHTWAPLSFLRRAIVAFWRDEDAESAKRQLDGLALPFSPQTKIRVYRGVPTVIRTSPLGSPTDPHNPDPFYLAPPRLEKNFLISPPGSPPIGWEPIKEDPPNAAPLAADLIAALQRLQVAQPPPRRSSSAEIVYEPSDATGGVGIVVSVEDFGDSPAGSDAEDGEQRWYAPPTKFVPTAMPPLVH